MRSRARRALAAATALVAAVTMASCGGGPAVTPTPAVANDPVPALTELETFYYQDIHWYPCGEKGGMQEADADTGPGTFSCARVTVPLNYDEPGGATIELICKQILIFIHILILIAVIKNFFSCSCNHFSSISECRLDERTVP